jgi:peptidoglycan/xylan/chitin deacetylase (PgdA/CDA1 family)
MVSPLNPPPYVERYADFRKRSARSTARGAALRALSAAQRLTGQQRSALRRPRVHFLLLHHLFPDEEAGFRRILDWLTATGHSFVSYSRAVEIVADGKIDRPYVALTFDDGAASSATAGRILAEYDARAIFFLNGETIGETDAAKTAAFCAEHGMPHYRFLSWQDAEWLIEIGHEIGDHTYGHLMLAGATAQQVSEELNRGRELLASRLGPISHFAWPHGNWQHFTVEARDAVFAAGYATCASAVRGAHVVPAGDTRFCIRRDNVRAGDPLDDVAYLMSRSARGASADSNLWSPLGSRTPEEKG